MSLPGSPAGGGSSEGGFAFLLLLYSSSIGDRDHKASEIGGGGAGLHVPANTAAAASPATAILAGPYTAPPSSLG